MKNISVIATLLLMKPVSSITEATCLNAQLCDAPRSALVADASAKRGAFATLRAQLGRVVVAWREAQRRKAIAQALRHLTPSQLKDMGAPPELIAGAVEQERVKRFLFSQRYGQG